MKLTLLGCILLLNLFWLPLNAQNYPNFKEKKVLIFSKTKGYRHASIPFGKKFFLEQASIYGFTADTTENAAVFTEENLKKYQTVVFLSTTGDVLDEKQQIAFERYIQSGGSYYGIHGSSDTEYKWPWYGKLVGGYFTSHPGGTVSNVQNGLMIVVDKKHDATSFMPDTFERKDEFYDFRDMYDGIKPLIKVDEKSYKQGKMGDNHPLSWYHEYDGGRSFYTNYGHTNETFEEPLIVKHLLGGLHYCLSVGPLNPSKAYSEYTPEDSRFKKIQLASKFDEPTEMAILPNNDILFLERKGKVKHYNQATKKVSTINEFEVYTKFEYGLMGINIDPNFEKNNLVYIYYAPVKGDTANRLVQVRFDPIAKKLDLKSEKIILKVPVKRVECCHTGGSIDWDAAGNLYLSTGDDTNPFASEGSGPMDNRAGREGWDARATSSNTNDLRGKVLRIKPDTKGGYSIPEGNLFAKGTLKTKPEIYTMGARNPYRISVDKRNGRLFWGDVGPDAAENTAKYGPRGYDEVNMAPKAGYYGWPLFVAENLPYNRRNFEDNSTGAAYDPAKPINDSPHNTGLIDLPPAKKAFIAYPYAESDKYGEIIKKGGRNAMAGPVYYFDDYKTSNVKWPKYYDKKFFFYDWMRDIINPITLLNNGEFATMERLAPTLKFSHPIDMAFGKDGALYVLEYGQNWFSQNDDSGLYRIEYNAGNRPPLITLNNFEKIGGHPMAVEVDATSSSDPDGDALSYLWTMPNGKTSTDKKVKFIFTKPGKYTQTLTVKDAKGNKSIEKMEFVIGNAKPEVDIAIVGNSSFYWDNEPIKYEVEVKDKEDGSLKTNEIAEDEIYISGDYLEGYDKTIIAQGHKTGDGFSYGKRLMELSDCKSCHANNTASIGPSYTEISKKYTGGSSNIAMLSNKIIKGGGGVWGAQPMSAHPQISVSDAKEMVKYILTIGKNPKSSLKTKGDYIAKGTKGAHILTASYTDKGANGQKSIKSQKQVVLRHSSMKAIEHDDQTGMMAYKIDGLGDVLIVMGDQSFAKYKDIDLTEIAKISFAAFVSDARLVGGKLEIRTDSPKGPKIGEIEINAAGGVAPKVATIEGTLGRKDIYIVGTNEALKGAPLFAISNMSFLK